MQNFEGHPSRFPRTNRASSIREHTRGMFRGTQTYRVSALWMQRSGPPPPPPLRFPTTPAGVYTGVRDGWLDGATLPLAFIYNQIPCIPATDARLNFYPLLLPPPSYVYTRARARMRAREPCVITRTSARVCSTLTRRECQRETEK